jgi:hypothetical protein
MIELPKKTRAKLTKEMRGDPVHISVNSSFSSRIKFEFFPSPRGFLILQFPNSTKEGRTNNRVSLSTNTSSMLHVGWFQQAAQESLIT